MKTDPNDSAYPATIWEVNKQGVNVGTDTPGFTKREILAIEFAKLIPRGNGGECARTARMQLADADALIAALNEEQDSNRKCEAKK